MFSTQYYFKLFLTLIIQFIVVRNGSPKANKKFLASYVIEIWWFSVSACFPHKFQTLFVLSVLTCCPLNHPWHYFRYVLFSLLLAVVINPGYRRKFWWNNTFKGKLYTCLCHNFLTLFKMSVLILLSLNIPWTYLW